MSPDVGNMGLVTKITIGRALLLLLVSATLTLIYLLLSLDKLSESHKDRGFPQFRRLSRLNRYGSNVDKTTIPPEGLSSEAPRSSHQEHRVFHNAASRTSPTLRCNCSNTQPSSQQAKDTDQDAFTVKAAKTGRHVNFYAGKERQNGPYVSSKYARGAQPLMWSKLDVYAKMQNASMKLKYIVSLLENLKQELNRTETSKRIKQHIEAGIIAVESLITSLSSVNTDPVAGEMHITENPGENSQKKVSVQYSGHGFRNENQTKEILCPETFRGTLFGYPFYEKGFVVEACEKETPLHHLLTLVFNFADYPAHFTVDITQLLRQVRRVYPKVAIVMAARRTEALEPDIDVSFRIDLDDSAYRPAAIWNALIARVTTPYTFIGRQLVRFDLDCRLERLTRTIQAQEVGLVGGATRTSDGRWSIGCHQLNHQNYTLFYRHGYRRSWHECLYCDHVEGPFVARTALLRSHPFDENIPTSTLFEDFYLNLSKQGIETVMCPDVMFHVRYSDGQLFHKSTWALMATKWRLNRIRLSSGKLHIFSCSDIRMDCAFTTGLVVPPCCLESLAQQIKFFMTTCEENHIICELQEGTLLGAVKMGKVLPWERDGDITFLSSNFSALVALKDVFHASGYTVQVSGQPRCCVEDRTAGGVFTVRGAYSPWTIEVYGYHRTDSETLLRQGMTPTRVFFDGMWVRAPRNPGLHVRNRYGQEMYRHAQHWISLGKYSGWDEYVPYQFTPCPIPGRHDCLDLYSVDGNLQFQEPNS